MGGGSVTTSVQRRRRWSREEKERLVAASFEPDVSVSELARSAGIHVSRLFRWRKDMCNWADTVSSQLDVSKNDNLCPPAAS
ncbi:MAG: transposase [Rhizobiaceae bacterium]